VKIKGGVFIRKRITTGKDIKTVAMAPFFDPRRKEAIRGKI
jgi:hypothetical protein